MPDPAPPPSPQLKQHSLALPLLVWLIVQLATLLAAVLQTKFSGNFPDPAERLALEEMFTIQITASALLMPLIFRDWSISILTIMTAMIFTLLAGFLSAETAGRMVMMMKYVVTWLFALALWRHVLRKFHWQLIVSSLAALYALGGPILWYLQHEYASSNPPMNFDWTADQYLGPIMAGFSLLFATPHTRAPWVLMGALIAAPLIVLASQKLSQQLVHKLSTK